MMKCQQVARFPQRITLTQIITLWTTSTSLNETLITQIVARKDQIMDLKTIKSIILIFKMLGNRLITIDRHSNQWKRPITNSSIQMAHRNTAPQDLKHPTISRLEPAPIELPTQKWIRRLQNPLYAVYISSSTQSTGRGCLRMKCRRSIE